MDDQLLVRRAQRGDGVAFETLVRRHTDTVWRFAYSMVRDDELAEDIVQETFIKAHRGLRSFRGDSAMTSWLYSICRRTVADHARRTAVTTVPLDAAAKVSSAPHAVAERVDLEAAIDALPEDEREAFVLACVLGYSQEEAATLVGIPASTMRSRVSRARIRLVEALEAEEEREQ